MTDDATTAAIRAAADAVIFKAREDKEYAQQFRDDPVGTLKAAGIDPAAAEQFGAEVLASEAPDVAGFARCDFGTCWVTFCNYRTGSGEDISLKCERMVGGVRG